MECNILVVDDIAVNRVVVKEALQSIEGANFIEAIDGVDALEMLTKHQISLVILDLIMPIKDGFAVLEEMKKTPSLCDIPVIIYSANEDVDSVSEALELGAYDYFTKPLKPREMKVILPKKAKNALKSYEQQKTIQELNFKMQVDLLMANILQQSLLNEKAQMKNATMYGKYLPTQEIGGDFYDCSQIGDTVWFIMANVSGNGVAAAMLTSMLKIEFQHCIRVLHSPDKVLRVMNNMFCKITQSEYSMTAFVGMIDKNTLWYSNAGQCYPLVFNEADQNITILRESNSGLGIVKDEKYTVHTLPVASGDIMLTYTQGLIEDKLMLDEFGVYDDLADSFLDYKHLISKDITEFFTALIRLFGNGTQEVVSNDTSMMLVCLK